MQLICDSESNGFKWEASLIHCLVGLEAEQNKLFIGLPNKNKIMLDKEAEIWYNKNKGALEKAQLVNNNINNNYLTNKLFLESSCSKAFTEIVFLQLEEFIQLLNLVDMQIWHNGFMHDLPLLQKLYPQYNPKQIEDTFILSNLFHADRPAPLGCKERHSIKAWGLRFGKEKIEESDWENFSVNMLIRCVEDTVIGHLTWEELNKERNSYDWEEAIKLEYDTALMQGQQEMNGVKFDQDLARATVERLDKEIAELDRKLYKLLPIRVVPGREEATPFKKNGDIKKIVVDYFR